jgi:hypothetical protein
MPLKGACVADGFWSLSYGIFAMHFSMAQYLFGLRFEPDKMRIIPLCV